MSAIIINFENQKQELRVKKIIQIEKLVNEYKQENSIYEQQIRDLVEQINQLQTNINFNTQLINKISQHRY
jgi:hypothetical protein